MGQNPHSEAIVNPTLLLDPTALLVWIITLLVGVDASNLSLDRTLLQAPF